jgi:DNA-binding transcriptional ArsR family regulator
MANNARFSEVALLAGEPARAGMLHALMDGRALTASELAHVAGITPQTASSHLARLTAAGMVCVAQQGRHRYHRLASPAVAQMIESIMQVAAGLASMRPAPITGPRDQALRVARTCYDHLAGKLGVALTDGLVASGYIELGHDGGLLTDSGRKFLTRIDLDIGTAAGRSKSARMLCRPCIDWSERRPHLAGVLGTALCCHSFDQDWIRRVKGTRAVAVTAKGRRVFRELLNVRLER